MSELEHDLPEALPEEDLQTAKKKKTGKVSAFFKRFLFLFIDARISVSAAALAYYITITVFPIIICVYTLLGRSYERLMDTMDVAAKVIPAATVNYILKFLDYVSENYSIIMMLLALSVILITASAAFRSLENTIGRMQGGRRFEGYVFFLASIGISLLFVMTVYLGIVVMFFGEALINFINRLLPNYDIASSWTYLRFAVLFAIALAIIFLIYEVCKRKEDRYPTAVGAFVATFGLVGLSVLFSLIINRSIKYPVVYSSLASVILLMFWLYTCSLVIYIGAVTNVALRDIRSENAE